MARRKPRPADESPMFMAPAAAEETDTALDDWIEQQRELVDTSLAQWTRNQQAMAAAWFQWLDSVSGMWRVPAWPGVPEDLFMAGPRMMQAFWAPWTPFVERGTEQLA